MPHIVASDLGLHCSPMSYKKDTRLIWVNCLLFHVSSVVDIQEDTLSSYQVRYLAETVKLMYEYLYHPYQL